MKTEALEHRQLLAVMVTPASDTVDPNDGVCRLLERLNNNPVNLVASEAALSFDQRGSGFDHVVGLRVDVGAVERQESPSILAALTISDASAAEGNRVEFEVTLDADFTNGFNIDISLSDQTATGGERLEGQTDYFNMVESIHFEGRAGEKHQFSVLTWDDGVDESEESFAVNIAADNLFIANPNPATGLIVEATSTINLSAGETIVTNENGTVIARNGEDIVFTKKRSDVAKLRFVGDERDSLLVVGDLGTYLGMEIVILYDGGDGTDEFRSLDPSRVMDLGSSIFQFTQIEQISVPTGASVKVAPADVSRIASNNRLAIDLPIDADVSLDDSWQQLNPTLAGDQVLFRAVRDHAILEVSAENAWHNPFLATDVNRDNTVSIADALLIVNSVSREGERILALPSELIEPPAFALDVSGDVRISTLQ